MRIFVFYHLTIETKVEKMAANTKVCTFKWPGLYAGKKKIERGTYYNIFSSQSQLLSRLLSDDLIAWTKRE